jgi:hypothetical protein
LTSALTFFVVFACSNNCLLDFFGCVCLVGDCLHHYKKFLAVAGVGAAITAVGLAMFVKTKKEEKHGCCH